MKIWRRYRVYFQCQRFERLKCDGFEILKTIFNFRKFSIDRIRQDHLRHLFEIKKVVTRGLAKWQTIGTPPIGNSLKL